MSNRKCEDWLTSFLEYSSFGEAPLKMLFWTGVSTVCGALRRRVWLDMKYFQWVPNMYIIMVAPPGIVSKSTTANIGMNLLRDVPGIHFGPDVVTWQALVESMSQNGELVLDKTTGEFYPMSCLTIASDEFGTFLNPDDREMVDVLVSLWDGKRGSFSKKTKMSGNDSIENPWINVIACTTPAWIAGNFPQYMIGGGFTSRCVFVYAEKKRQEIAYPDEHVPKDFSSLRADLVHDLTRISELFGAITLSPSAREWGREWYAQHWRNPSPELSTDQFAGYLARKQTHIHKLAMILSASAGDSLTISAKHLEYATEMLGAIEEDMPKVFANIGKSDITGGTSRIIAILQKEGTMTKTNLFRQLFHTLSYQDFEQALSGALNAQVLLQYQEGNEMMLRSIPK
jgi:hypothetical protein